MNNLLIKPTKNTPFVSFHKSGELIIEGRSYPNESINFFQPLFEWIQNYSNDHITFTIKLEYFNTSTCKQLLSLLRLMLDNNMDSNVRIRWIYDESDLDVLEIGQHMEGILNKNFEFDTCVEDNV